MRRQILADWIRERDLTVLHHVGQQQRGKHFRDRADLEDRVAIQRAPVALREGAVRDNPLACWFDNPDDDPDALSILVDSLDQDLPNLSI